MERPPLTLALASVVTARVDGDPRRLLTHLRPLNATTQAKVIPMPRRPVEQLQPEPDPAA